MRSWVSRWAGIALLAVLGCDPSPPSQVLVQLDAQACVTAGARSARVRVTRPDGTIALDREVSLVEGEEGATRFPLRIPVVPVGNDAARRFVLEAVVMGDAGRTLGDVRISTTFLPGEVGEVVGCFADRCAGVDCGACDADHADAGASCRTCDPTTGACVTAAVSPTPIAMGLDACPPTPPETSCGGGDDDDCDGAPDCADADCAIDRICARAEGACDDDRDGDMDTLVDCFDVEDCALDPACAPNERGRCTGGADDDGDGLIDCADALDCGRDPACVPREACTGGADEDGDGLIDCADVLDCSRGTEVEDGRCLENGIDDDCDGLTDGNDPQCARLSCRSTTWWRWCGTSCQSTHDEVSCGSCEVRCRPGRACRTDVADRQARCGCGVTADCPTGFECVPVAEGGGVCACRMGSCGTGFQCTPGPPSFCEPSAPVP